MNLLSLALSALLAFHTAPVKEANYHPRAEVRVGQSSEQEPGEMIFYTDIHFELGRFIDDESKLIVMDSDFGCLPEREVRAMVKNLLFTFDNDYIVEARDCDDLGLEFLVKLRRFFRDKTDDVPLAPAVGLVGVKLVSDVPEMGYLLEGRIGYHAVVIVRCAGGKYLLVDPGTKKVSEFTQYLYEGSIELRLVIF